MGEYLGGVGPESSGARQRAVIGSWSADVLAASIAGVAHAIELVDPPAGVEQRLGEIGRSLAGRFG